jgi:hypothetical protein
MLVFNKKYKFDRYENPLLQSQALTLTISHLRFCKSSVWHALMLTATTGSPLADLHVPLNHLYVQYVFY